MRPELRGAGIGRHGVASRRDFLLGAVATVLAGCKRESPPRALLYRLTITVDTPEGQKVGSSVGRLWIGFGDGPLGGMGAAIFINAKGAATVVDLGPRGHLLCLLERDERRRDSDTQWGLMGSLLMRSYPHEMKTPQVIDAIVEARSKVAVPLKRLPALVHFRDPNNPTTAEWVDPENLEKTFGPGVSISRVDYEILGKPPMKPGRPLTDEVEVSEVTASIALVQSLLPWIKLPREKVTELVAGSDLEPMTKNHVYGRSIIETDYVRSGQ